MFKRYFRIPIDIFRNLKVFVFEVWQSAFQASDKTVLIIPPAGAGSLGDQAMLQAVADHVDWLGSKSFRQILHPKWASFVISGRQRLNLRIILHEGCISDLKFERAVSNASAVVAIGADVVDGRYGIEPVRYLCNLLSIASLKGTPCALLGFSVSENPESEAMQLVNELPSSVRVFVRDSVSLERFEYVAKRHAELVADLAFLVKPDLVSTDYKTAQRWVNRMREIGGLIICLNINGLTASDHTKPLDPIQYWCRFLAHIWKHNPTANVVLLSHDNRPGVSDTALHLGVLKALPKSRRTSILVIRDQETAAGAKAIASLADVVLTGRMHLAIGALSLGVPTFCVAYAGKFEGLARHVGISDLCIPADKLTTPESSAEWLVGKFECLPTIRQDLKKVLPSVFELARRNFTWFKAS